MSLRGLASGSPDPAAAPSAHGSACTRSLSAGSAPRYKRKRLEHVRFAVSQKTNVSSHDCYQEVLFVCQRQSPDILWQKYSLTLAKRLYKTNASWSIPNERDRTGLLLSSIYSVKHFCKACLTSTNPHPTQTSLAVSENILPGSRVWIRRLCFLFPLKKRYKNNNVSSREVHFRALSLSKAACQVVSGNSFLLVFFFSFLNKNSI